MANKRLDQSEVLAVSLVKPVGPVDHQFKVVQWRKLFFRSIRYFVVSYGEIVHGYVVFLSIKNKHNFFGWVI